MEDAGGSHDLAHVLPLADASIIHAHMPHQDRKLHVDDRNARAGMSSSAACNSSAYSKKKSDNNAKN
eukprot:6208045-Pleurochrysis_carterae.AAC.3